MGIVYRALDLPMGSDALNGLPLAGPIPAETLNAVERAKGALLRTLFLPKMTGAASPHCWAIIARTPRK